MDKYGDFVSGNRNPRYAPKDSREREVKVPGRVVGVIAVKPKGLRSTEFNPCVIAFTVDLYRSDLNRVIEQGERKSKLSNYSKSLFHSCFKKW